MSEKWPGKASPDHSLLRSTQRLGASASPSTSMPLSKIPSKPYRRATPAASRRRVPLSADSLPRHSHKRPDLLERHRLAAFFETVVEVEDLALARREILLEDAVDELAHQLAVGLFLDLAA